MSKQPTAVIDALAEIDLFAGLSRRQLAAIADECRERRFPAGSEIVAEGDTAGRLYVIRSGEAVVNVHGTKVNSIGRGAVFGEIALIDRGPRSAQVVAVTDVDTYSLAAFNFRPLVRENADIAYRLLLAMCARLRQVESENFMC